MPNWADSVIQTKVHELEHLVNNCSNIFREGPNRSQAHNATTDQDIVLSQKGAGETVITDITHSKYGDDDLEPLSQSYADPDDNYVHLLGFKIPKLWRVLWGSGEEDKKIR